MKTVLLVEDDPFILDIYSLQIKKEGFNLDIAKSCEMALEKIKTSYPDLAILDISFAGGEMTGWDLLRELRKDPKTKNVKVIVITNTNKADYPEDAYTLGVIQFFLKVETGPEDITNAIKEIIK